ncbi:MAG: HTTM domain-containing protein [Chthoniobacterales bacterium]
MRERAFAPVDNSALVFFRIAFGVLMMWEVSRYFQYGWIPKYWIEPKFLFTYYGFSWVKPWPGNGLYIHWAALGVLAFFVATGFFYRVSVALFFLGFTYCFLLDQSTYLNHFYLVCLLSFLLIFLPAHRAFSVDVRLRPRLRTQTAPAWTIGLLRFQWAIVYFYGGVAKIAPDWLRGEPMRAWMAARTDFPVIGRFFGEEWAVYTISYGGLLLDLLIAPLLLWRRTRIPALCWVLMFHLINARLFRIGVFPWLGIAGATLFLSPDWPGRLLVRLLPRKVAPEAESLEPPGSALHQRLVLSLLSAYVALQVLVPLRHLLYPGPVAWTYEGHRFSWRMKLIDRDARARFYIVDDEQRKVTEVNPRSVLTRLQAGKMSARPDMILQFAHYLAATAPRLSTTPPRVQAHIIASINGRKPQLFVDQYVDLARQPRTLGHASWILALTEPLPATRREPAKPVKSDESEAAGE